MSIWFEQNLRDDLARALDKADKWKRLAATNVEAERAAGDKRLLTAVESGVHAAVEHATRVTAQRCAEIAMNYRLPMPTDGECAAAHRIGREIENEFGLTAKQRV